MRLDDVADIAQHGGGALLAIFLDEGAQAFGCPPAYRFANVGDRNPAAQLIAAQVLEADGLQDMDAVDHPPNGGLPVDRLQDTAGR